MSTTATAGPGAAGFAAAEAGFEKALGKVSERRFAFRVAGAVVQLRFAGDALADQMTRAFSHIQADAYADPDFIVQLWDSDSTGVTPPVAFDAGGVEPGGLSPRHLWRGSDGRMGVAQPGEGSLSLIEPATARGLFWFHDAAKLPFWEVASPLRLVLGWWLAARGTPLIHAGAVGRGGEGVLLVGRGGSGKSTTALSCAASMQFVSDDYAVLVPGIRPEVHSLYCSGKLEPDNLHRVGYAADMPWNADRLENEKAVVFVPEVAPDSVVASLQTRAVAASRIGAGSSTTYHPLPAAKAFAALAASTILQITGSRDEGLGPMAELLGSVPCYALELGNEAAEIPETINRLLDGVAE
ncbi:MAG: hypothetical protein WD757_01695 [Actinomycetota bacterium]